jgi:hypothetical protein
LQPYNVSENSVWQISYSCSCSSPRWAGVSPLGCWASVKFRAQKNRSCVRMRRGAEYAYMEGVTDGQSHGVDLDAFHARMAAWWATTTLREELGEEAAAPAASARRTWASNGQSRGNVRPERTRCVVANHKRARDRRREVRLVLRAVRARRFPRGTRTLRRGRLQGVCHCDTRRANG